MAKLLEVKDMRFAYGKTEVIHGISFDIEEGEIVTLIGANGAGKSTLMDTIAGVHKPSAGKIYFKGEDITGMPAEKIVTRGLSLVPQGSRCFIRMTVEDNLIMGSYPKHVRAKAKDSLERVYELFPVLKEKRNDLAGSLSGGQRQMVAVGRALMTNPECILFDEISLGLAPTVIKDIYARIRQINKEGMTVVLVEQDTNRAIRTGEFATVMLKGKTVLAGRSKELGEDEIKAAYFGL